MQSMNQLPIVIRPAQPTDLPAILDLLAENKLPPDGLVDHVETTLVACRAEQTVGSAALEMYGNAALLRSVAVARAFQNQGIGHRLVEQSVALARKHSVADIYLLTETASQFFLRLGFTAILRSEVPVAVQRSVEFTMACPQSALVMYWRIG